MKRRGSAGSSGILTGSWQKDGHGWRLVDGRWYYFNPQPDGTRGAMATDAWIEDTI